MGSILQQPSLSDVNQKDHAWIDRMSMSSECC